MPFGDGTGPRGRGPVTGRGLGHCGCQHAPGYAEGAIPGFSGFKKFVGGTFHPGRARSANREFETGSKFSQKKGRPYSFGVQSAEEAKKAEKEYLKREANELEKELEAMKDRLKELTEEGKS